MAKSRARKGGPRRPTPGPASAPSLPVTDRQGFLPEVLDRTVIAVPLLRDLEKEREDGTVRMIRDVLIDLNLEYRGGVEGARERSLSLIGEVVEALHKNPSAQGVREPTAEPGQYVVASLDGDAIRELVRRDVKSPSGPAPRSDRAIYHIWPDFPLKVLIDRSISTVKADAAHNSFAAFGEGVVWAIVDSGIDGTHPHFRQYRNLELGPPLVHRDFTSARDDPLVDRYGHGTHVAGVVAGQMTQADGLIRAVRRHRDENGRPTDVEISLE